MFYRLGAVLLALVLVLAGSTAWAGSVTVNLNFATPQFSTQADGTVIPSMEGCRTDGQPGEPLLPRRVVNILLPPQARLAGLKLTVTAEGAALLPGEYAVAPAQPDMASPVGRELISWGSANPDQKGRDSVSYGTDSFLPETWASLLPGSDLRKWRYARVMVTPLRYNAVARTLQWVKGVSLSLDYAESEQRASSVVLSDTVMDHLAPGLFVNYETGREWYPVGVGDSRSVVYDYVIITTGAIVANSTKLASFIAYKQSLGHSVLVVTEADFNGLTGQSPNHRAEKIRKWLINNYVSLGIQYVLLIGDPTPYESTEGDIPMKMCWPRLGESADQESPTDAFYADLTGNWDADGDGYYGEWADYSAAGGVDFSPEVWVGRIPVYDEEYSTLDSILQKIMDYQSSPAPQNAWRKSALLPSGYQDVGYDGAPLTEQMIDDYLGCRGYYHWTMYQQGTICAAANSSYSSNQELVGGTVVRDRWAAMNPGVMLWWGHGAPTYTVVGYSGCSANYMLRNTDVTNLNDAYPAFAYLNSCTNGYPESSVNLQYSLLKQGGIGVVSATRVSWFNTGVIYGYFDGSSTNSGLGYEFIQRITGGFGGGRALEEAKLASLGNLGSTTRLMNYYDFNLYGDPAVNIGQTGGFCGFIPMLLQ